MDSQFKHDPYPTDNYLFKIIIFDFLSKLFQSSHSLFYIYMYKEKSNEMFYSHENNLKILVMKNRFTKAIASKQQPDSSWHVSPRNAISFSFFELRILSIKEAKYIRLNAQCD